MKILKIILVILGFCLASVALYFILKAFGIANISTIRNLISKSGNWGIAVYTIILSTVLIIFCFVPLLNTALAILGIALFGSIPAFIANLIAVFVSNSILFLIGDKLGERFVVKLIGKEALENTQNKIDHKSKFWLPILFVTPGIPDEAICLVAGMTKMKYLHLILVSLIYHAVEIGLFCFVGSNIINWSSFTVIDWILAINIIIVDIYLLLKFEKYLDEKTNKKL